MFQFFEFQFVFDGVFGLRVVFGLEAVPGLLFVVDEVAQDPAGTTALSIGTLGTVLF